MDIGGAPIPILKFAQGREDDNMDRRAMLEPCAVTLQWPRSDLL